MSTAEKILVIDDNLEITRLIENVLIQEGYRVVVSNDALVGLSLVHREVPDLVIVDVCMPALDGWEICQRIRKEYRMPILVLTVLAETRNVERALRAGASAFMSKPFSIPGFLERVRSLLHKGIHRVGAERPVAPR